MKELLLAFALGAIGGRVAWVILRALLTHPALTRPNYRGTPLPAAGGIVIAVAFVAMEGWRASAGVVGLGVAGGVTRARSLVLLCVLGFCLLGLLDDVLGSDVDRGFRGHLAALGEGRLTTGAVKLAGGVAMSLVVCAPRAGRSPGWLVADAAIVALSANLGNLFDRRPGRAVKVAGLAFVALLVGTAGARVLGGVALVMGAAVAVLFDDLHERLMMGDSGSNVLGAVLGLGVVLACGPAARIGVLLAVAALNALGEVVSFSRVIDAVAPLRALDRAGRLRPPTP